MSPTLIYPKSAGAGLLSIPKTIPRGREATQVHYVEKERESLGDGHFVFCGILRGQFVCGCLCVDLGCGAVLKHQSNPFHALFLGTEEQQPAANPSSSMKEAGINRSNSEL